VSIHTDGPLMLARQRLENAVHTWSDSLYARLRLALFGGQADGPAVEGTRVAVALHLMRLDLSARSSSVRFCVSGRWFRFVLCLLGRPVLGAAAAGSMACHDSGRPVGGLSRRAIQPSGAVCRAGIPASLVQMEKEPPLVRRRLVVVPSMRGMKRMACLADRHPKLMLSGSTRLDKPSASQAESRWWSAAISLETGLSGPTSCLDNH